MSKQFAAVLQNVFRSINVNPDDVDYRICRRGFQYISGANHAKQMEVFTGVGPNEFEVISAIAEDRSFAFLKPRLTYDACSKVLIVKMPSTLHEAPLNKLKTVLERKLDYLPSHPSRSMVHANVHMNRSIRFDNKLPDLVVVMMIVIREDAPFNSPQQKSAAWEFFKSCGTLLSQKEFLIPCADLSEPICLSKSITIGGHTWCHLAAVEYFIWVREVGGNPINIDNSGADSSMRGTLFPEIRMGEVDAMFDKAISVFKDSIVLFFEWLGESFETGEIDEAIGWLKISWTDCWGHLTGGMKDTAYDRYQCWLQKYVLPRQKQKLSIVLPDIPASSRPHLDVRGGNSTQTTRMNTCAAALASLTVTPSRSSSSPSPSSSEVLSSSDNAIYSAGDV
ncbi:hypothetical protein PISMIDRAFT_16424 [Pisolithus microcarpus 441]|uniref:Uncharacterized protein n=1 Tax=Pisolithus microcarpus 441 TaxID=765257 RepID=A0A0C9XTC4_9AGAM|nr:hypothetical protein PISMIDRAFT_16424 [Pisolithus microcarpus 441]